jgi:hypothetical protein
MAKNYSGSNREPVRQMKERADRSAPLNKQGIDYLAQANHGGKEGKMGKEGYAQGDMKPVVEDFHLPGSAFSQRGFSKTTEYQERNNAHQEMAARDLDKQEYKGRYN